MGDDKGIRSQMVNILVFLLINMSELTGTMTTKAFFLDGGGSGELIDF